ncbi:MAG: uridine diphosphate-N-acetylglucosamine-binding protein YvcK, partial [Propionibacteriaceae bacterium]|nr:uridine diphosphate-N-acetylglucosamine-binding protein YvcK [Propionibacteriaceae bacterium]
AATLQALRRVTDRITAVVTVADDGGSSGRLRREFGCLPPGDLRMALAALCGDDSEGRLWARVLQSRFGGDGDLAGHPLGNLLIAMLWQLDDDPVVGLDRVGRLLDAAGRVLPMSSVPLTITGRVQGLDPADPTAITTVRGQAEVAATPGQVLTVQLTPSDPPAHPAVLEAVREADWLVFGPGSWFTSVVPHLLVPELAEAIVVTRARRLVILNLQPVKETAEYSASEHIDVLADYAPRLRLDVVVADPRFVDDRLDTAVRERGGELIVAPVGLADGSPKHDPLLLAATLSRAMGL